MMMMMMEESGPRDHLDLYEDSREVILEALKHLIIEDILRNEEDIEKNFKRLIALESIDEEGCTRDEYRVYRVWWMAVFKGVEFTRVDLDWDPRTGERK
jgi:hypothetical protein